MKLLFWSILSGFLFMMFFMMMVLWLMGIFKFSQSHANNDAPSITGSMGRSSSSSSSSIRSSSSGDHTSSSSSSIRSSSSSSNGKLKNHPTKYTLPGVIRA